MRTTLALCAVGALAGCAESTLVDPDPACQWTDVSLSPDPHELWTVDVLLVVDGSLDADPVPRRVAEQLPRFVRALASGEHDADRPSLSDMHLGVISMDIGVGEAIVPTCSEVGQNAELQRAGDTSTPGCEAVYPPYQTLGAEEDVDEVARALSCVARRVQGSCGFEQPLEATLRALSTSRSAVSFPADVTVQGDRSNAGFVRRSLLVVIIAAQDDDCSASDRSLFDPASPRYEGDLDHRCEAHPEALYPVRRYLDGLLSVRGADMADELLVFGVLGGVPPDLTTWHPDRVAAMLDDPRLSPGLDEEGWSRPTCQPPDGAPAFAPTRLLETAALLAGAGSPVTVGSLCEADYAPFFDALLERIAYTTDDRCIRGLDDRCELVEVLTGRDDGPTRCADVPGRGDEPVEVREDGAEVCRIDRVAPDSGQPGWYFDTSPAALASCPWDRGRRLAFGPLITPAGAFARLRCPDPDVPACER